MSEKPHIDKVEPAAAVAGGELTIHGQGLNGSDHAPSQVVIGENSARIIVAGHDKIIARVPEGSSGSSLLVRTPQGPTESVPVEIGVTIADNFHPVANPVVDPEGNIYTTFSGARGQRVPVSIFKINRNYQVKPFITNLLNATGLALDTGGNLFVSSRHDGAVYRIESDGTQTTYAESMGVATGLCFDRAGNLYVGDRTGTIFKISPDKQILIVTTLEPSVAAFHLAIGPDGMLYVTGPTTSSFDAVHRVTNTGEITVFYRGLGRPQGLAFDAEGTLYVVASLHGRRGVVRITPSGEAQLAISGQSLVGLAFAPGNRLVLASTNSLYHLNWPVAGLPLPPR